MLKFPLARPTICCPTLYHDIYFMTGLGEPAHRIFDKKEHMELK